MRDERGNIYVEALIAVAVLAIGLLPIFGGWSLTAGAQAQTGRKNAALAVARGYIEPLHALSHDTWSQPLNLGPLTDSGFTVTRTASVRPDLEGLKDVTVTVAWVDQKGTAQSVTLATAIARRP